MIPYVAYNNYYLILEMKKITQLLMIYNTHFSTQDWNNVLLIEVFWSYFVKIIFILIHYFIFRAFLTLYFYILYIFVNVIHLIIIHSCLLYFRENNPEEVLIHLIIISLFCKYLILNIFLFRTVIYFRLIMRKKLWY